MGKIRNRVDGWELRKSILSPILVNVISAFILFVIAVTFKESFLRFLGILQGVEGYPIYCIAEPFTDPDSAEVHVELFVINLEDKAFPGPEALAEELNKIVGPGQASRMGTAIKLRWKEGRPGSIYHIEPQDEFNSGKGTVIPKKLDDKTWEISVNSIKERGMLKLEILTNWQAEYITRASRQSVPFFIDYPGRK